MSTLFVLLLLGVGLTLAQDAAGPEIAVRAPSTFVNCDCQCEPHSFRHRGRNVGNCESADDTGANFCFVSRRSVRACRDTQVADPNFYGFRSRGRFISYEACTTPPRDQCQSANFNGQDNFGDGDRGQFGGEGGRRPGQFGGNQFAAFDGQTLNINLGGLLGLNGGAGSGQKPVNLASILGK